MVERECIAAWSNVYQTGTVVFN